MPDSTLNRFVASGTTAQRTAFVPAPPTPASGPSPSYLWWDTTLQKEFAWDAGSSAWVATSGSGTVTVTGSPASGNLTAFSGASSITSGNLSGDVTTAGALTTTLAASGVTAGSYGDATHIPQITLDAKGRATAATTVAVSPGGITQLTGDGTAGPGSGSQALTLATSGASAGTYGDATHVPVVTVDSKGRITAVSSVAVTTTGAGGSFVLLEQHTASASASLNFTTFISASYDTYVFEFVGIVPTTAGDSFLAVVGTGGGPTWDTGSNYRYADYSSDQTTASGAAGSGASTTSIHLYDNLGGTAAQGGLNGTCSIYDPANSTASKVLIFQGSGESAASNLRQYTGSGRYIPTTALTGVQFSMSTGTVASGTIRCYGVQKTTGGGGGGSTDIPFTSGIVSPVAPPTTGWTWVNQGASTVSLVSSAVSLTIPDPGGASANWHLYVRGPLPGTYTIVMHVVAVNQLVSSQLAGLYLYDPGTSKMAALEYLTQASTWILRVEHMTNPTTDAATVQSLSFVVGTFSLQSVFSFKVVEDGTHRTWSYSLDRGVNWVQLAQELTGAFLTPTQAGFGGMSAFGVGKYVGVTLLSWTGI